MIRISKNVTGQFNKKEQCSKYQNKTYLVKDDHLLSTINLRLNISAHSRCLNLAFLNIRI